MTTDQQGRIAFEAFKAQQGHYFDWALLTPALQLAWTAAADAVRKEMKSPEYAGPFTSGK